MAELYPHPFASLENEFLRVDYLTTLGPRLIGLYCKGVEGNLFAVTPDAHWPTPHGEYYMHGGHRLWTAPEDTYFMPPEDRIDIASENNTAILRSGMDASGLEKEINIRGVPSFEAVASEGLGVFATLKAISKLILNRLQ